MRYWITALIALGTLAGTAYAEGHHGRDCRDVVVVNKSVTVDRSVTNNSYTTQQVTENHVTNPTTVINNAQDSENHVKGGLFLDLYHPINKYIEAGVKTEYLTPGQRGVDARGEGKVLIGAAIRI